MPPLYRVTLSSVLWALQPSFILIAGRSIPSSSELFLSLNAAATGVLALVIIVARRHVARVRAVLSSRRIVRRLFVVVSVDAALISVAYVLLALSARIDNLASPAILFEAWPIFVTLGLFLLDRREGDLRPSVAFSSVFFIGGFVLMGLDNFSGANLTGLLQILVPVGAAISFGAAVLVVQIFIRQHEEFKELGPFCIVVALRGFLTALILLCMFLLRGDATAELTAPFVGYSLLLGAIVFATQWLYHPGVADKANPNAIALVALISPVLAPIFIFLFGLGVPSQKFFVGAAFVVAGLAASSRSEDNTFQFQTLMLAILLVGTVTVFVEGNPAEEYFSYVQTLAIFYGLLQASAMVRYYERLTKISELGAEARVAFRRDHPSRGSTLRAVVQKMRDVQSETSSISETLLLTALGLATVILSLGARANSIEGDSVAYLISVATVFMILLCWHYQVRVLNYRVLRGRIPKYSVGSVLRSRALSYAVSFTLFFWFLFVIIHKNVA